MHTSVDRTKLLLSIIGVVLAVFLVALFLFRSPLLNRREQYPLLLLNEGWHAEMNGEAREVQKLDLLDTGSLRVGDTWEISTTLPDVVVPSPALFFRTLQAVVEVSVDGEVAYTYGEDEMRAGKMLKRGICMARLPQDYMSKPVTIRFTATEPGAFSGLAPIRFGNEHELMQQYVGDSRLPLFFGVFLCFYAMLQILWMPYLLVREGASARPLFGAFITLLTGLYILGFYHLFELIFRYKVLSTVIEYMSLYLIPLALCAYLWTMLAGRLKRFYRFCMMLDIVLVLAVIVLHALGLVHMTLFLPIVYLVAFFESLPYILLTGGGIKGLAGTKTDDLDIAASRIAYVGFAVFDLSALLDMIFFINGKYFGTTEAFMGIPFMTAGSILFAMALTAQYFLQGVSHLRADVTRRQLEERAYTDPLTGLANRIRSEQEMQSLKITDPFVIISLDMDGLKKVNDSLGHAEGDQMLEGFARALKKTFGEMTLVGRMGGDEFLVILTGPQCSMINAKLNEFERELFDMNLEERRFYYSASYGYATNQETHYGRHVRDIYMLADRRMYDMKRKRKQEREAEA